MQGIICLFLHSMFGNMLCAFNCNVEAKYICLRGFCLLFYFFSAFTSETRQQNWMFVVLIFTAESGMIVAMGQRRKDTPHFLTPYA